MLIEDVISNDILQGKMSTKLYDQAPLCVTVSGVKWQQKKNKTMAANCKRPVGINTKAEGVNHIAGNGKDKESPNS